MNFCDALQSEIRGLNTEEAWRRQLYRTGVRRLMLWRDQSGRLRRGTGPGTDGDHIQACATIAEVVSVPKTRIHEISVASVGTARDVELLGRH